MALDRTILDDAAGWAVRTAEPAFDDWAAFTQWLELSPEHAAAYDRVTTAVEDSVAALASLPANDTESFGERPARRWLGPAIAACLALVATLWIWQAGGTQQVYQTAPGETRSIHLADGSVIVMAGATRLAVDPDQPRLARLDEGRALFEIRHDERKPFRLTVGAATLVDAGTVFDVNVRAAEVAVGVSEGAVIFNPERQNARIDAGQMLTFDKDSADYQRANLPRDQVGEWRDGRLTFRGAPLSQVAGDLARASGIAYRVADEGGARRISGSVAIDPLRTDPASIGPLLNVAVTRDGDQWILAPPR